MNLLNNISNFFGKYMAVIVLIVAAITLFIPNTGLWISLSWIMITFHLMGIHLYSGEIKRKRIFPEFRRGE